MPVRKAMTIIKSVLLLPILVACSVPGETPDLTTLLPQDGNAMVTVTDVEGERSGMARIGASATNRPDRITLNISSVVGFTRSYELDEWERLMAGETLALAFVQGGHASITAVYPVRPGVRIGRGATSERLTREGEQFIWTLEFGEATDSFGNVLTEEAQNVTVTVVSTPELICEGCIPGSEVEGGGCLTQYDPMYQSEYCRDAIERFSLVEYGFVDPALLE
jgi:hypothetical protein